MRQEPAGAVNGVPLALLLDTSDALRRAGRVVHELSDPSGASDDSRIAQAAIEAVLRGTGLSNPAERFMRDHREAALLRAARTLDDLDDRLDAAGLHAF